MCECVCVYGKKKKWINKQTFSKATMFKSMHTNRYFIVFKTKKSSTNTLILYTCKTFMFFFFFHLSCSFSSNLRCQFMGCLCLYVCVFGCVSMSHFISFISFSLFHFFLDWNAIANFLSSFYSKVIYHNNSFCVLKMYLIFI